MHHLDPVTDSRTGPTQRESHGSHVGLHMRPPPEGGGGGPKETQTQPPPPAIVAPRRGAPRSRSVRSAGGRGYGLGPPKGSPAGRSACGRWGRGADGVCRGRRGRGRRAGMQGNEVTAGSRGSVRGIQGQRPTGRYGSRGTARITMPDGSGVPTWGFCPIPPHLGLDGGSRPGRAAGGREPNPRATPRISIRHLGSQATALGFTPSFLGWPERLQGRSCGGWRDRRAPGSELGEGVSGFCAGTRD